MGTNFEELNEVIFTIKLTIQDMHNVLRNTKREAVEEVNLTGRLPQSLGDAMDLANLKKCYETIHNMGRMCASYITDIDELIDIFKQGGIKINDENGDYL